MAKPWITDDGVALLRKVERSITSAPGAYDQDNFCGTACCIAGHALLLTETVDMAPVSQLFPTKHGQPLWDANGIRTTWYGLAAEVVGMSQDSAGILFCPADRWPLPFRMQYELARGGKARACVAVRRIEHFIKTGE